MDGKDDFKILSEMVLSASVLRRSDSDTDR